MLFLFFLSLSFFSTKCTVRLSGRYISFLRNGLAKKLPSRRFRREEKCERKPSGFPFAFNNPPQRQNCKTELQNTFCNFEGSLAKDPKGLFDKLTVRLAGRYISFLRNGLAKKLPSRRFRREEKCERKPSGFPFAFNNPPQRQNCKTELQNTFCNFEGSLAKDPKGLFDKLTVRLAGRYISFLRNGLAKKLPSRRFRREDKGKTSGYPRYGKEPPLCHSEERSDVGISGKMFRIRRDFPEIQNSPARLPRPLRGLAMTRLGHLTSREPSGSLRLSKSLRFAE